MSQGVGDYIEKEPLLCNWCSGSGEGFYAESICQACKGLGEVSEVEDEYDEE